MLSLRDVRSICIGMIFALAGVFVGGLMEIVFWDNEDDFAEARRKQAVKNVEVFHNDAAAIEEAVETSTAYFERFYTEMLWMGMGSVAMLLTLACLKGPGAMKQIVGAALGLGAFFFPLTWLFAALLVTHDGPKKALSGFHMMAVMTSSVFLLGVLGLFLFFVGNLFRRDRKKPEGME